MRRNPLCQGALILICATTLLAQVKADRETQDAMDALLDANTEQQLITACSRVGDRGARAVAAVPNLVSLLRHSSPQVRQYSLIALGKVGPSSSRAVPQIIDMIQNDVSQDVRTAGVGALGGIGPSATDSVDLLIAIAEMKGIRRDRARGGETERASSAISSLGRIGGKRAIDFLIRTMQKSFPAVKSQDSEDYLARSHYMTAFAALSESGTTDKRFIAELRRARRLRNSEAIVIAADTALRKLNAE